MKDNDVKKYVNVRGDFEFPNFLYQTIMSLMKSTLDLGTLACSNAGQLRAFKETTKKSFKSKWKEVADVLYEFDLITPCGCKETDYCERCGGARFLTNDILNSDFINELVMFTSNKDVEQKLQFGHEKAIAEVGDKL